MTYSFLKKEKKIIYCVAKPTHIQFMQLMPNKTCLGFYMTVWSIKVLAEKKRKKVISINMHLSIMKIMLIMSIQMIFENN